MVMMVILGISIVGIYSMVNSGRQLATLTDLRLNAINIAREGLESVTTLRDTFALKGYESGTCGASGPSAFFSIDGQILLDSPINCPEISSTSPDYNDKKYILQDAKILQWWTTPPASFYVCINEFGWYSQEYSIKNGSWTGCAVGEKCPCINTTTLCTENTAHSCKTRFQRQITFRDDLSSGCGNINNAQYCVEVTSRVWWWEGPSDFVELSQVVTPLD
jgi:hypothetical protein